MATVNCISFFYLFYLILFFTKWFVLSLKIFYFKEGKAIYIKICLVKSGRQGSNLQDLRPKHSVIPNRLLPVYIKDVLEMSILEKKKE